MRLAPSDFSRPPKPIGHLRLHKDFDARNARSRKELAHRLEDFTPDGQPDPGPEESVPKELRVLRKKLQEHPSHTCPDLTRHLHYADRAKRLERELNGLNRRINRRTQTLSRKFDLVLNVLEDFSYVKDW